jgi:hypothetical protein
MHAMRNPIDARPAGFFRMALERTCRRQDGVALAGAEPQVAATLNGAGFEGETGLNSVLVRARFALDGKISRFNVGQGRRQEGGDGGGAFHSFDIPGEGHHVAPEAALVEEGQRGIDMARGERALELP